MIRLLLTVASAAAVVWFVGSRPDALTPEPEQARRVIERAARVVGEAVEVAGARAAGEQLSKPPAAATRPYQRPDSLRVRSPVAKSTHVRPKRWW